MLTVGVVRNSEVARSSNENVNERISAAITAGRSSGRITSRIVGQVPAPRSAAASSSTGFRATTRERTMIAVIAMVNGVWAATSVQKLSSKPVRV